MAVIRRLLALFRKPDARALLIARRAERIHNRKRFNADRYIAVHSILGKRNV